MPKSKKPNVSTALLLSKHAGALKKDKGDVTDLAKKLYKASSTTAFIAACKQYKDKPHVIVAALDRIKGDQLLKTFSDGDGRVRESELEKLKELGPTSVGRYINLVRLADKKYWLDFTDTDYLDIAESLGDLSDPQIHLTDDELYYFVSHLSLKNYAMLCNLNDNFQAKSMAILANRDKDSAQEIYNKIEFKEGYALLKKPPDKRNMLTKFADFLIINPAWFNQGEALIFRDPGETLNEGGECFGITGLWLTTDKFHNALRKEVRGQKSEYADKPIIGQITSLQRNAALQNQAMSRERQAFKGNEKSVSEKIIQEIAANPAKDRLQFTTIHPKEHTGHTMGLRITHEDKQIKLQYYDSNYGKREYTFPNNEKGLKQGAVFIKLCLKQSHADLLAYELTSRKELEQRYKPSLVHQADQKAAIQELRQQAANRSPESSPEQEKKKDKVEEKTPAVKDKRDRETKEPKASEKEPLMKEEKEVKYDATRWKNAIRQPTLYSYTDTRLNDIKNSQAFKDLVKHAETLFKDDRIHAFRVDKSDAVYELVVNLAKSRDLASFQTLLRDLKSHQDVTTNTMNKNGGMISRYELLNKGQGIFTRMFAWAGVKTTTARLIDEISKMAEDKSEQKADAKENASHRMG
ncbi:hypothetical protein B1207_09265 [Legionella quinlivanii]|uniref:DrrA phosphatidylinositol 4-phosphate binding domain-containing protein n=1 Tax=Legionella quinlivanii TaxID=45073 RepID=A0A364LIW6_9GAMM|nr:hypothetical protein [Legionella quinlivanii]RAP36324.1 hypothetical protein B1207_09265 [Legionella quinlivanii]